MARTAMGVVLSVLGATVGVALGIAASMWLKSQGYYAMILPGALLGLGANLASPRRSQVRGVFLGIAGLLVGMLAEWRLFPVGDRSLGFFLGHLADQPMVTKLMLGFGALFAYWWGREPSPWADRLMHPVDSLQVKGRVEGEHD